MPPTSWSSRAPAPSSGSGTASLLNGDHRDLSSGTYSDPAGAPGAANSGWNTTSYPPQGTSNKTAGVQFNVSTLGYQNILLAWEQTAQRHRQQIRPPPIHVRMGPTSPMEMSSR